MLQLYGCLCGGFTPTQRSCRFSMWWVQMFQTGNGEINKSFQYFSILFRKALGSGPVQVCLFPDVISEERSVLCDSNLLSHVLQVENLKSSPREWHVALACELIISNWWNKEIFLPRGTTASFVSANPPKWHLCMFKWWSKGGSQMTLF